MKRPKIRWYVWTGGRSNERIPKVSTMRGFWPGYDAECSCGWGSHTGGAIESRVREAVQDHLYFEHQIETGPYRGMASYEAAASSRIESSACER